MVAFDDSNADPDLLPFRLLVVFRDDHIATFDGFPRREGKGAGRRFKLARRCLSSERERAKDQV